MSGDCTAVADTVEDTEDLKRRTRNRICKHCKFSTSSAKEFLHHQLTAHNDSDSPSTGDIAELSGSSPLDIPKQKRIQYSSHLLSPGHHSSTGSSSQPGSPIIMSDSEMIEGEAEEEFMSGGDADDREEMVIGKAVLPTRTYTCQDCGMSTTSARNHLYHQLEEHKYDFIIYECDICDYATRYKQKLPRHRKCHFNNLRPGVHRSPQVSTSIMNNNNNVISPKHAGGTDLPVFPDDPSMEEAEVDDGNMEEDQNNIALSPVQEDNTSDQGQPPDNNMRVGKLVCAENPNSMETIQLVDEFDNSGDGDGEGALQIDMSRGEDEQPKPPTPVKVKPVIKEGTRSPSVLKPKPKRTTPVRQWVDPAKYVTLTDEEGIKYSCSKCGNVYKWRKSLSKHWKEKHDNETPPPIQNRPSSYTSLSIPKLSPAANTEKPAASLSKYSPSQIHSKYSSPVRSNFNRHTSQHLMSPVTYDRSTYKISSHPKSPQLPSPNMAPSAGMIPKPAHSFSDPSSNTKCDVDALDLSVKSQTVKCEVKHEPLSAAGSNIPIQDQPLDFSSKNYNLVTQFNTNGSDEYLKLNHKPVLNPNEDARSVQCSKCAYVAVSMEDFKRHFETHTKKKFQRCGQCHAQFADVDDLNRHFVIEHQEQLEDFMEEEESLLKSHLMAPPISQQMAALSSNCMVCSVSFSTNYELARHFSNTHSNLPNPYLKKNYMSFGINKRGLQDSYEQPEAKRQRLIENRDMSDRVHSCNICGYSSSWKSDLTLHMKKYHPLMLSRSRDGSPHINDQNMLLPTVLSSHNNAKNSSIKSVTTPQSMQVTVDSPPQASTASLSSHQHYLADIPDNVDLTQEGTVLVIPEAPEEKVTKDNVQKFQTSPSRGKQPKQSPSSSAEMLLPYKCSVCEYRARWPSEITQHMKNHSDEKPYCCPRCSYRSKWKWDVVKHLKRCGGGTIKDVIDTTKINKDKAENTKTSAATPQVVPPVKSSTTSAPPNVTVVPGASLQEPPKPQGSSSEPSGKQTNTKQTIFRSIINQGQYHCLECPFVGSSPAELKRHVILHSDEKPFSCRDCSYSSRWKCDLKKHLRTYSHQPAQKVILASSRGRRSLITKQSNRSPQMSPVASSSPTSQTACSSMSVSSANPTIAAAVLNASPVSTSAPSPSPSETSSQSGKSMLYQCEKCPYATHKKNILESHMKIHTPRTEMGSRLRCKQCDFEAADLPEFLQHKLTHSQVNQEHENATSKTSIYDVDTDSQSPKEDPFGHSMRHRRKPIRQYKCSKCPYVCFKKNGLELHEAMHEPRGEDAHKCLYCDYNVYNTSLLQQHLRLHPEHHQQQWGEEGEEQPEADTYFTDPNPDPDPDPWGMQQPTDTEDNNDEQLYEDDADDFMNMDDEEEERLQQQVVTQEMSIMAASAVDNHTPTEALSDASSSDALVLDLAKKKVVPTDTVAMFSISDYEDRLPRDVWPATYQCKMCPYLTQHRSNYDKHVRMHGTNNKFTCEWCDWSIDRLNLLYRHAKCVHPHELAKQEKNDFFDKVRDKSPVVLNINPKPKKIKAVAPFYVESNKTASATDLSLSRSSTPNSNTFTSNAGKNNSEDNSSMKMSFSAFHDHIPDPDNSRSFSHPVTSSSSTPAHTVPSGVTVATGIGRKRKKLYTCQKCGYSTDILSNIQRHCEKHGQMARYVCDYCDYALDRQNLLWQHMKLVHKVTVKPEFMSPKHISQSLSNSLNNSGSSTNRNFFEYNPNEADDYKMKERLNYETAEETVDDACLDLTGQETADVQSGEDNADVNLDLPTECSDASDVTWKGEVMQMYEVGEKRLYRCGKCKYTTSNITSCSNHMKQHGASRRYTCEYCDYSLDQVHLLYHHMKTIHSDEMQHLENEMSEDEAEPFSVEEYLKSDFHTKDNHQPVISLLKSEQKPAILPAQPVKPTNGDQQQGKRKLLECHLCPYKVKSKEALNKHLSMHEQKRKYTCKYCDYSVDRMNLMYQHIRVHNETQHSESLLSEDDQKTTSGEVKDEKVQEKVPPLKIITKPKSYVSISKRIPKVKNRLRYGCSKCPYTSFCKSNIAKHRKLHIIRSKYKCHYCNYSATRWFLLNQHVKCHEEQDENRTENIVYDSPVKSESGSSSPANQQDNEDGIKTNGEAMEEGTNIIKFNEGLEMKANRQRPYMCKNCPFGTNSSFEFRKHVRLHGVSLKYKCDYCSYSVDRLNLMYQHRKLHSKDEDFNPIPAPRTLLNKPVWSNMQKELMKGIQKMKTEKDSDKTNGVNGNDAEVKQEKSEENELDLSNKFLKADGSRSKFQCKMCPQRCSALSKLKVHVMMHGMVKRYICDHCDWSSDRLNLLYQHRRVHRFETNYNPDAPKESLVNEAYQPNSPSARVLSILPKLQASMQPKTRRRVSEDEGKSKKLYSCKLCPFSCDNKQNFANHKNLHRTPGQYQCEKCSFSVNRLNLLYQHKKLHDLPSGGQREKKPSLPKKRLKCPKCPYHTHSHTLLDLHSTMHASGRKYTCQFCDYSIDRFNLLQQHMKVHLDNRSSDSVRSEANVSQTTSVKTHENKVTPLAEKGRRFSCNRCPYTTTSRPNFETHKVQHSSKNKLLCSFCDYSIGRIDHMMNHIKLHLPDPNIAAEEVNAMIIRTGDSQTSDSKSSQQLNVAEEAEINPQENKSQHREGVYTCQYCDREFDNEQTMQRHEAQHLIGY